MPDPGNRRGIRRRLRNHRVKSNRQERLAYELQRLGYWSVTARAWLQEVIDSPATRGDALVGLRSLLEVQSNDAVVEKVTRMFPTERKLIARLKQVVAELASRPPPAKITPA